MISTVYWLSISTIYSSKFIHCVCCITIEILIKEVISNIFLLVISFWEYFNFRTRTVFNGCIQNPWNLFALFNAWIQKKNRSLRNPPKTYGHIIDTIWPARILNNLCESVCAWYNNRKYSNKYSLDSCEDLLNEVEFSRIGYKTKILANRSQLIEGEIGNYAEYYLHCNMFLASWNDSFIWLTSVIYFVLMFTRLN